ncbi:hypothetical protein ROZALSC1DRAFT_28984 [Rozella allomycis CSF55]|uniref:Uncharacterized protein n=1 Tax=Rozella allomycis (strain CSF55) TaxID=988480 RepID=A0A4P9YJ60_ROZAC|nr:hypothetical protein ROZALSC1DRAFT_28984 [Rozella allomycis CSF55]
METGNMTYPLEMSIESANSVTHAEINNKERNKIQTKLKNSDIEETFILRQVWKILEAKYNGAQFWKDFEAGDNDFIRNFRAGKILTLSCLVNDFYAFINELRKSQRFDSKATEFHDTFLTLISPYIEIKLEKVVYNSHRKNGNFLFSSLPRETISKEMLETTVLEIEPNDDMAPSRSFTLATCINDYKELEQKPTQRNSKTRFTCNDTGTSSFMPRYDSMGQTFDYDEFLWLECLKNEKQIADLEEEIRHSNFHYNHLRKICDIMSGEESAMEIDSIEYDSEYNNTTRPPSRTETLEFEDIIDFHSEDFAYLITEWAKLVDYRLEKCILQPFPIEQSLHQPQKITYNGVLNPNNLVYISENNTRKSVFVKGKKKRYPKIRM